MSEVDERLDVPTSDLASFPRSTIGNDISFFRAVTLARIPWWFGSDGSQRFDLAPPKGTCYVAANMEAAIREKGRRPVLATGRLDPGFLTSFSLYELRFPEPVNVADTFTDAAVHFGASRELSTTGNYRLTCQWAAAFNAAGFDGVGYASRFTSGATANAVAVFSTAGDARWPYVRKLSGLEAALEAGLGNMILTLPSSKSTTMITPPRL